MVSARRVTGESICANLRAPSPAPAHFSILCPATECLFLVRQGHAPGVLVMPPAASQPDPALHGMATPYVLDRPFPKLYDSEDAACQNYNPFVPVIRPSNKSAGGGIQSALPSLGARKESAQRVDNSHQDCFAAEKKKELAQTYYAHAKRFEVQVYGIVQLVSTVSKCSARILNL
jgi:hypothetical protein